MKILERDVDLEEALQSEDSNSMDEVQENILVGKFKGNQVLKITNIVDVNIKAIAFPRRNFKTNRE